MGPEGPTHFAVAPSNKSYAQQGQLIVGFAANGKPDQKFGSHGRVSVVPGPGKVIEVSGVAVDSQNRVLVAGTYEPFPGFKNPIAKGTGENLLFGNEPATEAFVIRFLPSGAPDPTFGNGGVVISSLDAPVPNNEPFGQKPATAEYERPVVTVSGIKVDSQDRPVLAAQYTYAERTCFYKQQYKHAIVARLTAAGALDTTFGNGGFIVIEGERTLGLASGPGGEWAALGERERACKSDIPPYWSTLAMFSEAGAPAALDPGRPRLIATGALAVDGQGRILLAESPEESGGQPKITRLLPNGDVDTGFGHGGGIVLSRFAPGTPVALAVDGKERVVVGLGYGKRLELTRLTPAGKLEGKFGNRGLALAPKNGANLEGLGIDSKGRLVAAGSIESNATLKTGQGIGIARFLPGG